MMATRLSVLGSIALDRLARLGIHFVGDKALECADVDRLVEVTPVAGRFAAMVADAPADAGEGIVFFDDAQRVVVAAFADEGDVALRALTGGAGVATRGEALFLNRIGVGDGLRVELVGRALLDHSLVEASGDDDGAHLRRTRRSRCTWLRQCSAACGGRSR